MQQQPVAGVAMGMQAMAGSGMPVVQPASSNRAALNHRLAGGAAAFGASTAEAAVAVKDSVTAENNEKRRQMSADLDRVRSQSRQSRQMAQLAEKETGSGGDGNGNGNGDLLDVENGNGGNANASGSSSNVNSLISNESLSNNANTKNNNVISLAVPSESNANANAANFNVAGSAAPRPGKKDS